MALQYPTAVSLMGLRVGIERRAGAHVIPQQIAA